VSSVYFESPTQVCPERTNNEEESTEKKKERMYTTDKYRDVDMYIYVRGKENFIKQIRHKSNMRVYWMNI
jgi:hypothetical protein